MNDIKVFENSEFGKLEVLWENGKEYFPARDVQKYWDILIRMKQYAGIVRGA